MLHRRHIPSSRGVRASKHTPAFLSTNINLRNRTFTMLVTTLDKQLNLTTFAYLLSCSLQFQGFVKIAKRISNEACNYYVQHFVHSRPLLLYTLAAPPKTKTCTKTPPNCSTNQMGAREVSNQNNLTASNLTRVWPIAKQMLHESY